MFNFEIPDDWGNDSLTEFINAANQNTYSVSVHYKNWFNAIRNIDSLFLKFTENSINLPVFYEPFLLVRAHSSYRAAIRLATSGQLSEAFSLLRGCLEYALYAFYFNKHPSEIQTWIDRDENENGKKKARKDLATGTMIYHLTQKDKFIGDAVRHLYELTIDVGAHPNRKTITLAMQRTDTEDSVFYHQAQLNTEELQMTFCLKTTVQVGICLIKVFRLVFPERFDILGISAEIEKISRKPINGLYL